jgi:hypothetical protein
MILTTSPDIQKINAHGEGSVVTRLEGVGAGENFLSLGKVSRRNFGRDNNGEVTYAPGAAPVRVDIFNLL